MRYLPTILLGAAFGVFCGGFQYWMAARLVKKRWLLLLQPVLFAAVGLCFGVWVLSLDELYDPAARFIPLVFVIMLTCVIAGWMVGNARRKRKE